MIDRLRGTLVAKAPLHVTVDVHGVGYALAISLQTYEDLPAPGAEVDLLTHLLVREDALQLFGFLREEERAMFRQLQSVSGIGARMAMTILSGCGASDLRQYVRTGNVGALTAIPGVGRKTAERIVVELRDKLAKASPQDVPSGMRDLRGEAVLALVTLGYSRQSAEKAVSDVFGESDGGEKSPIGDIVKAALRRISK